MTYVPVAEVTNRCNSVLGVGNWRPEVRNTETWGVQETVYGPCPVHVVATIRVHVRDDETGEWTWADGMGGQDVNFYKDRSKGPTNLGDAYKGACSDGMKKALQHFGVGLELARDGQPSEIFEETVDLTAAVANLDDAGAKLLGIEWRKRGYQFKRNEVPESLAVEVQTLIDSCVGSGGNAQERSDGVAAAKTYQAAEVKDALVSEFRVKLNLAEQVARKKAKLVLDRCDFADLAVFTSEQLDTVMDAAEREIEQDDKELARANGAPV